MGQADRTGYKTKADATFRFGSLGAGVGARVGNPNRTAGVTRKAMPRVQAAIAPSKPIPPPTLQYFANKPADNPNPQANDLRRQIQSLYDTVGTYQNKIKDSVGNMFDGSEVDEEHKRLDVYSEVQRGYHNLTDNVARIGNGLREHPYTAPDRPQEDKLKEIRANVDIALRDGTWTPQEKQQILDSYRGYVKKFVSDDEEDTKSLNNWAVQSAFKQLVSNARKQKDADAPKGGDAFTDFFGLANQPTDDLGKFYNGPLSSAADDQYAQGFILAADANGWFKIENISTLQHVIGAQARDDPAFAAKLIHGMAAYGAYGGGTDKYAGDRIAFDKRGNPVSATFNVDDDKALTVFLGLIAKDQEQAMNAQELQPWDTIMDTRVSQNAPIAASPSYGNQSGAPARRGYGYGGGGFGGGGGGGGISYTDSDQLKQLINGIARSRLGTTLNDQQVAEFVANYHSKEAAFINARIAGKDGQQLDAESQAAAWIEGHFRDPMAANQANNYISSLASFLLGGSFGSSS